MGARMDNADAHTLLANMAGAFRRHLSDDDFQLVERAADTCTFGALLMGVLLSGAYDSNQQLARFALQCAKRALQSPKAD